jgi:tRNA/tmRNA/rRNA uracil-C5-methylase (TrmA/RlmC/RlmD family)
MQSLPHTEKRKRRRGAKGREAALQENKIQESTNSVSVSDSTRHEETTSNVGGEIPSLKRKIEQVLQKTPLTNNSDSAADTTTIKNSSSNKKQKVPKEGEPGYMTKTQLRNARKRRAKQKKQQQVADRKESQSSETKKSKKKQGKQCNKQKVSNNDPSLKYIRDPKSAPLVKKAKTYFAEKQIPFSIYLDKVTGWRTVSKLPVRRADNGKQSCVIGLFQPGSHAIVKVPDYPSHHPSINKAIRFLQQECDKMGIEPFNEFDGSGILRYVCINVERSTGKIQLTLVWNASPYKENDEHQEGKDLLEKFCKQLVSKANTIQLHSLWVHFNSQWKHADNIFDYGSDGSCKDDLWKHIFGPKHMEEVLSIPSCEISEKVTLFFPPNVFRQANLDAFTNIVNKIRMYIKNYINKVRQTSTDPLPSCVELYGGVGTIGLNLCDLVSKLVCSDENPHNRACFERTVEMLSSKNRMKCSYIPKNASDVIREDNILLKDCEILVVDPPRKGLDEYVTKSITEASARRNGPKLLVYVSCGFDAFTRDSEILLNSGKWSIDKAEGHVLFPGADAIETLAFFKRVDDGKE